MQGKFITFEGSEGCGKSTQSKLLYDYLRNKGFRVVYLREPGGVKISEQIRALLLNPRNEISPATETLLYMAARSEVVSQLIKPALSAGKIVICDRFLDSTIAYQGYGLGIDIKTIKFLGEFATLGIKPDLTILLDLPVRKGLLHRKNKEDRIELRALSYHEKVRMGYLALARQEPGRIKIVKLDDDIKVTHLKIMRLVESLVQSDSHKKRDSHFAND